MADAKKDDPKKDEAPLAPDPALLRAPAPAGPKPKTNETVKGGRYIVGGKAVDANGVELEEQATEEELRENPPAPPAPPQYVVVQPAAQQAGPL